MTRTEFTRAELRCILGPMTRSLGSFAACLLLGCSTQVTPIGDEAPVEPEGPQGAETATPAAPGTSSSVVPTGSIPTAPGTPASPGTPDGSGDPTSPAVPSPTSANPARPSDPNPSEPAGGGGGGGSSPQVPPTDPDGGVGGGLPPRDDTVLEQLETYLATPRDQRPALEAQAFAEIPLGADQATQAVTSLWNDYAEHIRDTRSAEHEARSITLGDATLRYDFRTFGDAPAAGRSLYLSLHGGGNAAASVNDSQWENQKTLYQPDEGIYLAPRAPTNTWNLWHEAHIDPLFQRLITNFIVFEGVNPNRVYVMGYSAGGDGVYQLGPRMADHWAAAAAMAGHPNEAQPLSLRNIGFTIHVGALDTAYDRNLVAAQWGERLDALSAADPGGYPHVVQVHAGKPHWMDLEDAVAVPWMAEFTRNPTPTRVVWYQDDITHGRSYWLAVDEPRGETELRAELDGQSITLQSEDVSRVRVRLSDALLDLDQPISIFFNGSEIFTGPVPRTIRTLALTLEERGDPALVFPAEVVVEQ